jgi:GT2 family glycosyltransferase
VGEPIEQPDDVAGIEARMNYVVGASMMARRTFIDRVGLMTEDYFLYYEELDWAERGRALGFGLGYAANSVVYHKEGATIGTSHRRKSSALAMRYLNRNRLLFTHRFYPQHMQAVRRQMWYEVLVYTKHRDWGAVKGLLGALLRTPAARVGAP